jgi:hypothetical protein
MRRRLFWVHTAGLSSYSLLALFLTWPLAFFFGSHVPGDGIDDPSLAWNLWWIKARLIDQLRFDIFHVDWLFFPIEINLGFYTLTPLNGFLSIPLQTGLSLIAASNLILLSSFVLSGYGTFLLVRYLLTRDEGRRTKDEGQSSVTSDQLSVISDRLSALSSLLPAFAAGIVYAFASSKLFYVSLGQFNIASSQWIPFTVLYVIRTGQSRRPHDAALAALFLTFQAWSELTYASFLLIFIAVYFVWTVISDQASVINRPASFVFRLSSFVSFLLPFLLMGALFSLGISPFLWAMLPDLLREGDFFASGGGFADIFSADLMGYLLPTRLHPLFGDWAATLPFPNDKGQQIFLGYSAMLLGIIGSVGLIRRRGWRGLFWPLMAIFFWWLTLGAEARWAGQPLGIPGPFSLISQLPFFSGNRYPSRYTVMLMLAVAVLVGWGLVRIYELRIKNGWGSHLRGRPIFILTSFFLLLFLFEHLSTPLPLNDFRVPPIYAQIAAEPGDFAVLELPTGWRNGARVMGKSDVLIMMQQWYQTEHGKRRLGGNTSRNPVYKFQYFTEAPLIGDLIPLMNDERGPDGQPYLAATIEDAWPELVARNREIAPFVLGFLNVRFVTVHVEKSPPSLLRFIEDVLPVTFVDEWQGLDWTGAASTLRLYRVDEPSPPQGWQLDFGSSLGQILAAEGWSAVGMDGVRYATRPQVDLLLDLRPAGGQLRLQLFGPAALTGIALNGESLPWTATPSTGESQIAVVQIPVDRADLPVDRADLPVDRADLPVDRLTLRFDELYPLSHLWRDRVDGWSIGSTGVALPVDRPLLVRSAGKDAGDFAQILVAGANVAQSAVGYNLVALNAAGIVLDSVAFNTLISSSESAAMANWLAQWPAGTVIAGAVRDEASYNLGEDAVSALRGVGVATDVRGAFRSSHAFIGVVGAPTGSALEAFSPFHPATVALGPPVDASQISGGVGRIEFEPSNR